jgi:hypothetical protein
MAMPLEIQVHVFKNVAELDHYLAVRQRSHNEKK